MGFRGSSIALIVVALIFQVSCGNKAALFSGSSKNDDLQELLAIAEDADSTPLERYAALEPVISRLREEGKIHWLGSLLSVVLEEHPNDPYGAYYLMVLAEGARESGSKELSLDYLRRLVRSRPDLEIRGQSLHLLAMGEIATETESPLEAIAMRQAMGQHFPDRIDQGRNLFALAEEYRRVGDWEAMYQAYRDFLAHGETSIPGVPHARSWVQNALRIHAGSKAWTMENLDDLVGAIKYAIRTQNAALLIRHQSDDFFQMNWSQEVSDDSTHDPMVLGDFLKSGIRYRRDLESFSNDNEAYLWTAGWSWKIPTWYFYFRRIDYPVDPELNRRWEWAGIYFGERL